MTVKITLLNGNPESSNQKFDAYLSSLASELQSSNHSVKSLLCRELEIKSCVGCWDCWIQTPGRCSHTDDTTRTRTAILDSDLTIWASPLVMGFTSALLKRVQDKLIPILSPFPRYTEGEIHNSPRYPHYPAFGLLMEAEADTDDEDISITKTLYSRLALSFITKLRFAATCNQSIKEVSHAINML